MNSLILPYTGTFMNLSPFNYCHILSAFGTRGRVMLFWCKALSPEKFPFSFSGSRSDLLRGTAIAKALTRNPS